MFTKLFSKSKFHLDSLGFHLESPQRCQRPLTSHFRAGGGVGVEAEVQELWPALQPRAQCPGCGDAGRGRTLLGGHLGQSAPRRSACAASRAPRQPSAWGAELAAASPRAAHYSSVTGEADAPGGAKSRTGLRRADSPPATPPPRAAVSDPKESCGVCATEREGVKQCE